MVNYSRPSCNGRADIIDYHNHRNQIPRITAHHRPRRSPYQPVPSSHQDQPLFEIPLQDIGTSTPTSTMNLSNNQSPQSSTAHIPENSVRYVAIFPPSGSPLLDFRPFCLTTPVLWINTIICIIFAVLVLTILYLVGQDHQALLTSANAHLLSTYCPALLATINLMCFRATFFEYFRMLPYFRMADQNGRITTGATAAKSLGGSYFPWLFASYSDDPWLKISSQIFLIAIGFLTTFKSVYLGSQETKDGWILTVHARPAYYLVSAYLSMALFYITLWLVTRNRSTGLKWDAAAPCDHLALVWRTNAMPLVAELPINSRKAYTILDPNVKWRVGYWLRYERKAGGPLVETVIHGIGTVEETSAKPCEEEGICTCQRSLRCTFAKRLYPPTSHPGFMAIFLVSILIFIGFCTYIAAAGIFKNGKDLTGSWLKLNTTYTPNENDPGENDSDISGGYIIVAGQVITIGDSTVANIVLRAVPTYIAGLYAPYFSGMEIRLRDITWVSALASGPQSSSKSLALEYATQISVVVPITAAEHGHFRLMLVAFVNIFAALLPVFVAGLVIFERPAADRLRLVISKTSYIVLCVYLIFFLAATIAAWPRKTELLLRPFYSIADLVKPFADSWLLEEDTALDSAMSEKTREKFRARVLLAEYHYQLGVTRGTCGKSHRGIDIVGNESEDKYRTIIPANQLIMEMETHKKESHDVYSMLEAGLDHLQQGLRAGTGMRTI